MYTYILLGCLFLLSPTLVQADLYQWTDTEGVIHVVGDEGEVPETYRAKMKVYRSKSAAPNNSSTALLAPSRTYRANSQGAFAQKLALDLGVISYSTEDAIGPLTSAGIQPAGGWRVDDPLTRASLYEVVAAARRASDSQRLRLSADGAEAVAQQAATPFLPSPAVVQTPPPTTYNEELQYAEPEVIVEQQPPQVIEVIQEPVYVAPSPVIFGSPQRRHSDHGSDSPPSSPPLTGPFTPNPAGAPTQQPFGASHMPFGASHMPFGANRAAPQR
jgi:hypothetical protein